MSEIIHEITYDDAEFLYTRMDRFYRQLAAHYKLDKRLYKFKGRLPAANIQRILDEVHAEQSRRYGVSVDDPDFKAHVVEKARAIAMQKAEELRQAAETPTQTEQNLAL